MWVHEAVMVEILVVQGEASHSSHLGVTGLVEALAHHQHGIVYHVGGALGHGVHADNVNNAYDALKGEPLSVKHQSELVFLHPICRNQFRRGL